MYRISFALILIFNMSLLSVIRADASENSPHPLVDLFHVDSCLEEPCLFGRSVRDADFQRVMEILEATPVMEHAVFVESEPNRIQWEWDYLMNELFYGFQTSDWFNENYGYNSIYFDADGHINYVRFLMRFRLGELLALFGEPIAYPWSYSRFWDMYYRLEFETVGGYFMLSTQCETPEFAPDSLIMEFVSTANPRGDYPLVIEWKGYTNNLPTCVIFQP